MDLLLAFDSCFSNATECHHVWPYCVQVFVFLSKLTDLFESTAIKHHGQEHKEKMKFHWPKQFEKRNPSHTFTMSSGSVQPASQPVYVCVCARTMSALHLSNILLLSMNSTWVFTKCTQNAQKPRKCIIWAVVRLANCQWRTHVDLRMR